MPTGNVKGAGVLPFLQYYAREQGREALARAVSGMPEEHRRHFRAEDPTAGVLAATWYPAPAIHSLLDHLFEGVPPGRRRALVDGAARFTIDTTLRGVYKFLFTTMMSVDRYARRAQDLFSRYYDTGVMTKTPEGGNSHVSVVREWTSHHPVLCELLLSTGPYVYEKLGCRDVRMERTACVADGGEECRFVIRWT
jgi:hypothetical protein